MQKNDQSIMSTAVRTSLGVVVALAAGVPAVAQPSVLDFLDVTSWESPPPETVSQVLDDWLAVQPVGDDLRQQALRHWEDSLPDYEDETARLDALAMALAAGNSRVAEIVRTCQSPDAGLVPPNYQWLIDSTTAPLVGPNMRVYYARWLVQSGLHDEALEYLEGLAVDDVVVPATLLFYRAVAHHQLVHPDRAESLAQRLLERPAELPIRYRQLAELMQQDVAGLEADSLDHIARRMSDIERRLDKGRAGETVQQVEQEVIAALDKMIDELEKQQQQMQQQSQLGGTPSGTPMEESRPAELKAPGKVEQKELGGLADWGDLPPEEREQALQEIGREFPAHYREVIEQYFRELANEASEGATPSSQP